MNELPTNEQSSHQRHSTRHTTKHSDFLARLVLLGLFVTPASVLAQVSLGTAGDFGVLAGSTVTNIGPTIVTGHVGTSPGSSVTGFPPGAVVGGTIHLADAVAGQAQSDLVTAYNAAAGEVCTVDLTGQDLGGQILTPGVYCFSTSAQLTGTLTLDFQGDSEALFIFQTGSTLTTASASAVVLINNQGATCPNNLFWQIGSSATLGTGTAFAGNILALHSITMNSGASLNGRSLARGGAVTLSSNTVTACLPATGCPVITVNPATLPDGALGFPYNETVTASGGTGPYVFSIPSGSLPPGLLLDGATGAITGIPTMVGVFDFTIQATDVNGCVGSATYSIAIGTTALIIPTLGGTGQLLLLVLLVGAGLWVMNRSRAPLGNESNRADR